MSALITAADMAAEREISSRTNINYLSKINIIIQFVKSNFPEFIIVVNNKDDLKLPLTKEIIKEIFGWLSISKELPNRGRKRKINDQNQPSLDFTHGSAGENFSAADVTISTSCMQSYKSALKWYYKVHKVSFTAQLSENDMEPLETAVDRIIDGYKILLQQKRQLVL